MASLDRSDSHRAAQYLELAEDGETSGSTDQGPGGPTAVGEGGDETGEPDPAPGRPAADANEPG